MKFLLFLTICSFSLIAQESDLKRIIAQDKMVCVSIPTEIDGVEVQKSLKCLSKDAVCLIVEGFAMSCFSRPPGYPSEIPKINPISP